MEPAQLRAVELRRIALDLVSPFRTSFGTQTDRDVLLVHVTTDVGDGWGECVAGDDPLYSSEYTEAAEHVIRAHLLPRLFAHRGARVAAHEVGVALDPVKGHRMAKAAVECAVLDAELRSQGRSVAEHLGAVRERVPSGVSVGIVGSIAELIDVVGGYLDAGYVRIKLKIEPGWDVEPVRAVRAEFGDALPLQVDANAAYRRGDARHLAQLDEAGLLLIEQPLPEDDLLGHAELATRIATPVCLDESITSARAAADAIALGACSIVNVKAGRVGGYLEARRVHDVCAAHGVPVWCGGMLETGIGRAMNAALAALPGFTLTGDISASTRFWTRDIVTEPMQVVDGHVPVPTGPGTGVELDESFVDSVTTSTETVTAAAVASSPMTHPFLSEAWIQAAKEIRHKYADQHPPVTQVIKVNQVITDAPFGGGTIEAYVDTSNGEMEVELGKLDEPDVTITTDWATARAIFALGDQAAGMQAFMGGKIKVQGDMMKMMALQTAMPQTEITQKIAEEIKQITE